MRANQSGQSTLLLIDVIDILKGLNISYAVIGALAASFYGNIRASIDADAIISLKENGLNELVEKLNKSGLDSTQKKGDLDDPLIGIITIHDKYNNQVDLVIGIKGMREDYVSRVVHSDFNGSEVCFIGIEDFIAMKVFAGGQKDIEDIKGVLEVSKEKIDMDLLKELTLNYGGDELVKLESMLDNKV